MGVLRETVRQERYLSVASARLGDECSSVRSVRRAPEPFSDLGMAVREEGIDGAEIRLPVPLEPWQPNVSQVAVSATAAVNCRAPDASRGVS